jgi:hypothetical protein
MPFSTPRAILFLLPFIYHPAWGQGLYAFDHPSEGAAQRIFKVEGNKIWLTGGWQSEKRGDFVGMTVATIWGDSLHFQPIHVLHGEEAYLMHFIKKPKSVIYIGLRYELGCRFLAEGNFIYNFNEHFQPYGKPVRVNYFFKNIKEPLREAVFIDDNTLAITQGNLLVSYQVNQRKALAFNDSLNSFSNLLPISSGLFVCTEGSKFHIMDHLCKVVSSSYMGLVPKQIIPIKGSPTGYLALASNRLDVLNGSGQSVYEHNWQLVSPVFDSLDRMFYLGDSLFILGMKNHHWVLAKLNRNFDFLDTLTLPTRGLRPVDIALDGPWVYAVLAPATGHDQRMGYLGRFHRNKPMIPPTAYPSITQVQVDSLHGRQAGLSLHPIFYTSFTLTNTDTLALRHISILWRSSTDSTCLGQEKSRSYTLHLLPNQDTTLYLDLVDSFLTPNTLYELCITASSPNGKLGLGAQSNACATVLLPPLGLAEPPTHWQPPTALRQGEALSLPDQVAYQWHSLTGKLMYQGKGGFLHIPQQLPKGVYLLVVLIDNEPTPYRVLVF